MEMSSIATEAGAVLNLRHAPPRNRKPRLMPIAMCAPYPRNAGGVAPTAKDASPETRRFRSALRVCRRCRAGMQRDGAARTRALMRLSLEGEGEAAAHAKRLVLARPHLADRRKKDTRTGAA